MCATLTSVAHFATAGWLSAENMVGGKRNWCKLDKKKKPTITDAAPQGRENRVCEGYILKTRQRLLTTQAQVQLLLLLLLFQEKVGEENKTLHMTT